MAVQWITIAALSGPAAQHLWEQAGAARQHEDNEEEIPVRVWKRLLAPVLDAIDRNAAQPPIWSYHRSVDPWLMGDVIGAPFADLPARQIRIVSCRQGPESLYLTYRTDWAAWLKQLDHCQQRLSKRELGYTEKNLLVEKLHDAALWCNVLAKRLPAAVFLRRTFLRSSSGDEELAAIANQSPAWLTKLPTC